MNKNRSVVIVRHNDAIDGVLCKVRHFFGIVLRWHIGCSLTRSLSFYARIRCIDMHWTDVFGASVQQLRLCSNFGWSTAFSFQFIYFCFGAVCDFFFFSCLFFIWFFNNDRMRQAIVLFHFIFSLVFYMSANWSNTLSIENNRIHCMLLIMGSFTI